MGPCDCRSSLPSPQRTSAHRQGGTPSALARRRQLACLDGWHRASKHLTSCQPWYAGPMAQQESPREDLLRDATALVERIELAPRITCGESPCKDRREQSVVAGF